MRGPTTEDVDALVDWPKRSTRRSPSSASPYARSKFEDTRRKAQKFGARGTTVKAYKPSA